MAHEATHYYETPKPDGVVRRWTTYRFDKDVAETSATTYDEYGKIGRGPGFLQEFVSGARNYLGVDATFITDHTVYLDHGGGVADAKKRFVSAFTPPILLDQETVVTSEKGSTIAEIKKASIGADYAGAVLDVAVAIATDSSNVHIKTNRSQDDGAHTQSTQGIGYISVNPNVIENSKVNIEVAASYDGFWILMHELFHRANRTNYKMLAAAQNRTFMVKQREKASFRESGPEGGEPADEMNWRKDPPDSRLNPILSFMNVLRAGFGLPIREKYGENSNDVIPFDATSPSQTRGEDFGVYRGPDGKDPSRPTSSPVARDEIAQVHDLVGRHYKSNAGLTWIDRVKSAKLELEDPTDFSTHTFTPHTADVTGNKYEVWSATQDGNRKLHLFGSWGVGNDGEADDGRKTSQCLTLGVSTST